MKDKHKFIFHYYISLSINYMQETQYMQQKSILGYCWKTNQNIIAICMIFHNT